MSEVDEIDELRALTIAQHDDACRHMPRDIATLCIMDTLGFCACLVVARAIRLSDEAAGYITARLETLESAKERRS